MWLCVLMRKLTLSWLCPVPAMRALIATFLKAAAAGVLYEILKDGVFPRITLGQSQAVTVVVIGFAAVLTHYLVRRNRIVLLAERETKFRLLFAHNPLPMYVYDAETLRFLEVNDAATAHYGYSRVEFLELRIVDIRPEIGRAHV